MPSQITLFTYISDQYLPDGTFQMHVNSGVILLPNYRHSCRLGENEVTFHMFHPERIMSTMSLQPCLGFVTSNSDSTIVKRIHDNKDAWFMPHEIMFLLHQMDEPEGFKRQGENNLFQVFQPPFFRTNANEDVIALWRNLGQPDRWVRASMLKDPWYFPSEDIVTLIVN